MPARKRTPNRQLPLDPDLKSSFAVQNEFAWDEEQSEMDRQDSLLPRYIRLLREHSDTDRRSSLLNTYTRFLMVQSEMEGSRLLNVVYNYGRRDLYRSTPGVDLTRRVELLENRMEYGVRPMLALVARHMELANVEKDTIPAAASAEYEWEDQVRKIVSTTEKMLSAFEDLEIRLKYYNSLIDQTRELLKLTRFIGEPTLRSAVLVVHDALCGVYSEDLTRTQAELIVSALDRLENLEWDREMVRALHRELRASGFETIPSDKHVDLYSERIRT